MTVIHALTSISRAAPRLAGLAAMLLGGAVVVATAFPFASERARGALRRGWSAATLRVLGVRLRVQGRPAIPGSLLVANHVSWLDVLAINAVLPVIFVCKTEVRNWPLIGWLAERNGTVFIRRGSTMHARTVNERLAQALKAGATVAVFPEGTTSEGRTVLGFRSALLQAAIDAQAPVQPLALEYMDEAGAPHGAAPFVGNASFIASLLAVAAAPRVRARLNIGGLLPPRADGRRVLARAARERIVMMLEEPSRRRLAIGASEDLPPGKLA